MPLEICTHYSLNAVGRILRQQVCSLSSTSSTSLPRGSFPSGEKLQLLLTTTKKSLPWLHSHLLLHLSTLLCSKITQRSCFYSFSLITLLQFPLKPEPIWLHIHNFPWLSSFSGSIFSVPCIGLLFSQLINVGRTQGSAYGALFSLSIPPLVISFGLMSLKAIHMLKIPTVTSPNWASLLDSMFRSNFLLSIFYYMSTIRFKL